MNNCILRYLACGVLSLGMGIAPVFGQLHGSVTVQGDYLPDVIAAERINILPGFTKFAAPTSATPYSLDGVNASFMPSFLPIGATAAEASRIPFGQRGYLDVRAGSWLDASLSAGVRAFGDDNHRLDVWLQHNSTSLWRPDKNLPGHRYSYQEGIGLQYSHGFSKAGTLTAALQYRLGYFDYYGAPVAKDSYYPSQTLSDFAVRLGWVSNRPEVRGSMYKIDAGVRGFMYRVGEREVDFNLAGKYAFQWGERSSMGFDADFNLLTYTASADVNKAPTYGVFSLTPYYAWGQDNMTLRLGADIDIAGNAQDVVSGSKYGAIHIAPDVRFAVRGRKVGFFADLLGGSELQTLALMSQRDSHCMPWLASTKPTYSPLDARVGLNFGPYSGFSASMQAAYKIAKNVPFGGWYMAMLNYGGDTMPGLEIPRGATPLYGECPGVTLSGFSGSVTLDYSLAEKVDVSLSGSYQPQGAKTGYFNGIDRPRWVAAFDVALHPIKKLGINFGCDYRGVRRFYCGYELPQISGVIIDGGVHIGYAAMRLPDVINLHLGVRWDFTERCGMSLSVDNLLNRREMLVPMLPSEGIGVYAGLHLVF